MNQIFDFVSQNKTEIMAVVYALYELAVRLKPTDKTWSLLTLVGRLIEDKNKEGSVH